MLGVVGRGKKQPRRDNAARAAKITWCTKKRQQIQRHPKAHTGLPSALSAPKRVPAAGEQRLVLCKPLRQ